MSGVLKLLTCKMWSKIWIKSPLISSFLLYFLQLPFPKKLPFSEFVPKVYCQLKEFIYACLKYSEDLHLRYPSLTCFLPPFSVQLEILISLCTALLVTTNYCVDLGGCRQPRASSETPRSVTSFPTKSTPTFSNFESMSANKTRNSLYFLWKQCM